MTGAGRGIGRGVALELARRGARVALVARSSEELESAASEIAGAGGEAFPVVGDVAQEAWLEDLQAVLPEVDVLVNNAPAFAPFGRLEESSPEDLAQVSAVMLGGAFRATRRLLPGMRERGFGRIVNVGSAAGGLGAPGQAIYSSVKAALGGLTRSTAVEAARDGVTCNLVELGLIDTERTIDGLGPGLRDALVQASAMRRSGTVEEAVAAICFLTSPGASFITGATLPVQGGLGLGLGAFELP